MRTYRNLLLKLLSKDKMIHINNPTKCRVQVVVTSRYHKL